MSKNFRFAALAAVAIIGTLTTQTADAAVVRVSEAAFVAGSGQITFSGPLGAINPTYNSADYGGGPTSPTVTFGGYFTGQSIGGPGSCPPGAAPTGCVVGTPTATLTIDPNSPDTFITGDGSNPTSPVLSGSPLFNGPIAILFSTPQAGVGLEGGFFNSIDGTAITAYGINGEVLGSVTNNQLGIEFLGLVTSDKSATIAGLLFSLVGAEDAGFAIDNLRFGVADQVVVPPPTNAVPGPIAGAGLPALLAFGGFVWARRRKAALPVTA